VVGHACDPRYSGGRDRRFEAQDQLGQKSYRDPISSEKKKKKKEGGHDGACR
jgi:hypothetical protein